MYTVKGGIENAVILPDKRLEHREGERVLLWAKGDAEMKARDLADDCAEGRLSSVASYQGVL